MPIETIHNALIEIRGQQVLLDSDVARTELVENFHHFNRLKHSPVTPKAFSEKGLYMLVAILDTKKATLSLPKGDDP